VAFAHLTGHRVPMTCAHCTDARNFFSSKVARKELKRYRKKGPTGTAARILDQLGTLGIRPRTHLDIGAGVGILYHETLTSGAIRAVHVDAAPDYIEAARREAERRGHADHVDYHVGNYVELADGIDEVDLVTLDRVICCYPDARALVEASARKVKEAYAVSYLRDRRWIRFLISVGNLYLRLRGSDFRVYVHPIEEVDATAAGHGLTPMARHEGFLWHTSTYLPVD